MKWPLGFYTASLESTGSEPVGYQRLENKVTVCYSPDMRLALLSLHNQSSCLAQQLILMIWINVFFHELKYFHTAKV